MTRRIKTTLEAKLCLLTIGTVFVVLLGVGHLAMNHYRASVVAQKKEAFESVTRALALSASRLATGSDPQLVKSVRSRVQNSHLELEYIIVADQNGRTLFAASKDLPKKPYPQGMRWWMVVRRIVGYGGIDPGNIHSVTVPVQIGEGKAGTFTAGFDLHGAREIADSVQQLALLALALGLVVGTLCALALARSMSNSLRSLIRGAKAVSNGDFGFRLKGGTRDEIEELADAFNFMVETLSNSNDKLIEKANTDSLTGLYNHRHFQERLATEVHRASRYGHALSMLMVDIDFFKSFNDAYGHPSGDAALQSMAQVLTDSIRQVDVAVRYGGEEFAVILPETKIDEALVIAERIRKAVEEFGFKDEDGESVGLTVSIGAAEFPCHCTDRTGLVSAADVALYEAKSLGRNQVYCFDCNIDKLPQPDPHKLYVLLHAHNLPTIEALADAIDSKLKLPAGHSRSIAKMASATAKELDLDDTQSASIYLAALLKDVGQIAVPDSLLAKPETLTAEEMSTVSTHPGIGHSIVQKTPHMTSVMPAVLHHHERYDGTGYPSGMAGENIPLPARILAVADAYQAMITDRPHRKRLSHEEARAELVAKSSTQFDPKVVKTLLRVLDQVMPKKQAA